MKTDYDLEERLLDYSARIIRLVEGGELERKAVHPPQYRYARPP
jgi:hypothetical protein